MRAVLFLLLAASAACAGPDLAPPPQKQAPIGNCTYCAAADLTLVTWDSPASSHHPASSIDLRLGRTRAITPVDTVRWSGRHHLDVLWSPTGKYAAVSYRIPPRESQFFSVFQASPQGLDEIRISPIVAIGTFLPKTDPAWRRSLFVESVSLAHWIDKNHLAVNLVAFFAAHEGYTKVSYEITCVVHRTVQPISAGQTAYTIVKEGTPSLK